ncbi:MAG: hypothetical protein ACXADH_02660 [Candidatus Kariarchaeaceae archaeon]|jgi:hypothetical protein
MGIDLIKLKSSIEEKWKEFATDLDETITKLGLTTAYGLLVSASFLPLIDSYSTDPISTTLALRGILSNVGINLLSNFIQRVFEKKLSPAQLEELAKEDPEVQQVLDALIAQTESIRFAQDALGDKWSEFSTRLESELQKLSYAPNSLSILTGEISDSSLMITPVSLSLADGATLNIQGDLLVQNIGQSFPVEQRIEPKKSPIKRRTIEPKRKQIYKLELDDLEQASISLNEWRFVRTFTTEPFGALANGILGIGQPEGTTFSRAPIPPRVNCSVECDMRIIDDGGDPTHWAGIRVRGLWDDIQFGYLTYMRREGTVELYRAREVIGGKNQQIILDTKDNWTTLRVDILNTRISIWVNGKLHLDVRDKTFCNKGHVYLHTFGVHAQFRDFCIYRITK